MHIITTSALGLEQRLSGKLAETHDPVPGLLVLCSRLLDHVLWQLDAILVSQPLGDQPVSQVLLVKARLGLALLVRGRRPVPRRVGREDLVDEDQGFAVKLAIGRWEQAKLEFGVRQNQTASKRIFCGFR